MRSPSRTEAGNDTSALQYEHVVVNAGMNELSMILCASTATGYCHQYCWAISRSCLAQQARLSVLAVRYSMRAGPS